MTMRNDYLKLAEECAIMARTARWPETCTVWEQMAKLYRYLAERAAGIGAPPDDPLDRRPRMY
jgi:hypothetical protein